MNIVLVNRWYPPHSGYGGIASYNYSLARALTRLGHRVTVLAARLTPEAPKREQRDGVTVRRVRLGHYPRLSRLPWIGRQMRGLQQFWYSVKLALTLLSLGPKPDLVEFAEVEAEGFVYLFCPGRAPVIVRCHTPTRILKRYYLAEELRYSTGLIEWMEKTCLQRADLLTAPSRDMADTVSEVYGASRSNIRVIPNAVDTSFFSPGPRPERENAQELRIIYVGRLDRIKGIEVLARAIPKVLAEASDCVFLFVGEDIPDKVGSTWRQRLESTLKAQVSGRSVQFLGALDSQHLLSCYRGADMALVPSLLYESFSYTCAQAMACALPVVASRIGGLPETLEDGKCGILVEPGDPDALAEAILRLARDPSLRQRLGRGAREKAVKRYDSDIIAREFLEAAASIPR